MATEDEKFLRLALDLAKESLARDGGPFGAVVVKDGGVVAEGQNNVVVMNDPTAHAEIMAIRKACDLLKSFSLEGCTLYSSCEPCPMCLAAIYWARIDRVVWAATRDDAAHAGFDDASIYWELALPSQERKLSCACILPDEGRTVLEAWAQKTDKVKY